jgi:hypothetical protein
VLLALATVFMAGPADAQAPSGEVTYTRQPSFKIPFQTDPGDRRLKQVQLYVSPDSGVSWHPYANAPPDQRFFNFTADRDGLFWFSVRTVDSDGRAYPMTVDGLRPGLKVWVDTQPPVVTLRALPPRDGMVGVEWEVRDETLDPASPRLEYHLPGTAEWLPLGGQQPATGQYFWKPPANGTLEVRLQAVDKAGNRGEGKASVVAAVQPGAAYAPPAAGPAVRMVNNKRISLNYKVEDVGPSGVSVVELWFTKDGRNWSKYAEKPNQPPFVFDVDDEGLYGLTLVVRSGVGLGDRPPQVNDPPQVWVEVDITKPIVRLFDAEVGRGTDAGNLTVTWLATDKNLGRQPITLSYAEKPEGPWTPIAAKVENSGRYVWKMPPGVPFKFLVRVEAEDRAGNVGAAETPKPVLVDLHQPRPVILDIESAKGTPAN